MYAANDSHLYSRINAVKSYEWNKKICFEARDALFECVESTDNQNKFKCPDQLYSYEMWCPADVRRIFSRDREYKQLDEKLYDRDLVAQVNRDKQLTQTGQFGLY